MKIRVGRGRRAGQRHLVWMLPLFTTAMACSPGARDSKPPSLWVRFTFPDNAEGVRAGDLAFKATRYEDHPPPLEVVNALIESCAVATYPELTPLTLGVPSVVSTPPPEVPVNGYDYWSEITMVVQEPLAPRQYFLFLSDVPRGTTVTSEPTNRIHEEAGRIGVRFTPGASGQADGRRTAASIAAEHERAPRSRNPKPAGVSDHHGCPLPASPPRGICEHAGGVRPVGLGRGRAAGNAGAVQFGRVMRQGSGGLHA